MKAVGCVVLVAAVAVAVFAGVVFLVLSRGGGQGSLTRRVDLTVVGQPRETYVPNQGSAYEIDYAYEVDGRWYGSEDRIRDNYWQPGTPLTGCVDPAKPRDHVVTIRGEACGRDVIVGGGVQHAAATEAPARTD